MKLPNPILKSIPARDLDIFQGKAPLVALPTHVEVGGIPYTLSVPQGLDGVVYSAEEVLVPRRIVDLLDIKYDITLEKNSSHATLPPVFSMQDIPTLDTFPEDTQPGLDTQDVRGILDDFLKLYSLLTDNNEWKNFTEAERLQKLPQYIEECMKHERVFGGPVAQSLFADLVVSASTKQTLRSTLPLLKSLRYAHFSSLEIPDAQIFETTLLLVYLALLQKISGPLFVYDYILGGIHPKLYNLISEAKMVELNVTLGGTLHTIRKKEDAKKLLELLDVSIDDTGKVAVEVTGDIEFSSAKLLFDDKGIELLLNENVSIPRGTMLPYVAKLVNGAEVAVLSVIPSSGITTALTESNVTFDKKQIGVLHKGEDSTPIMLTIVRPANYRGFGKLKAVVPSIITLGEYRFSNFDKVAVSATKEAAREKLLELVQRKSKTLKDIQHILEKSATMLNKPILELVNVDSIFAPQYREFVIKYIKENHFVLAPLGYNLSAQLLSYLKLLGLSARGRQVLEIPEYTSLFNTLWNAINGLSDTSSYLSTTFQEFSENHMSTAERILSVAAFTILEKLAAKTASKVVTVPQLQEKYRDNLSTASAIDRGVTALYSLKAKDAVFIQNIPTRSPFKYSRSGLFVFDLDGGGKIVIPLIISITETDVPQPNDGIQYLEGMVDILSGLQNTELIVYPTIFLTGSIHDGKLVLAYPEKEQYSIYLMKDSLERELTEADPYVHQNSVLISVNNRWLQAIGNKFITKCRCKV